MKRITFWFLSTLSVVVLLFGYDGSTSATTSTTSPPAAISSTTPGTTTGSSSGSSSGTSSGSSGSGSGTTKVTGSVASTRWGPVQVQLTISSGTITGVTVLQQPSGNPKDTEINDQALPILTQETTAAQSAHIDMVSGATVTSTGYLESLQSALDKAGL
jgi:uncharacterized protein with FMN-binding domain